MATIGLLAGLWLLLGAAASNAVPVTLYADGDQIAGFDAVDVANAINRGFDQPITVDGIGSPNCGDETVFIPCFSLITPDTIPYDLGGGSKADPAKGTSTWTLQIRDETPEDLLQDFYLVILGHSLNDPLPYLTENVGLEVNTGSPWRLFRSADFPEEIYLAYFLGNLDPLVDYQIPIEYRVGQQLLLSGRQFEFPRYWVNFANVAVPEPSTWMLLTAALAGLWVAGTRRA